MAQTLLLDTVAWDLVVDANGNIAVASEPYSLAQDAASAIQTFRGEVFYDTTVGIPYFNFILGKSIPLSLLKAQFIDQAELVPDVAFAQCFFSGISQRSLTGQVQIVSISGKTAVLPFTVVDPQGP
jgi:hypothetical protein